MSERDFRIEAEIIAQHVVLTIIGVAIYNQRILIQFLSGQMSFSELAEMDHAPTVELLITDI